MTAEQPHLIVLKSLVFSMPGVLSLIINNLIHPTLTTLLVRVSNSSTRTSGIRPMAAVPDV